MIFANIIGRLTQEPKFLRTSTEKDYCVVNIASNVKIGYEDKTTFVSCKFFNERDVKFLERFGKKGHMFVITGSLYNNPYNGKPNLTLEGNSITFPPFKTDKEDKEETEEIKVKKEVVVQIPEKLEEEQIPF